MDIDYLIQQLGYDGDTGLIDPLAQDCPAGLAHHFRRAHDDCNVRAVYALRAPQGGTAIPLIYLAEADSEDQAAQIHRMVWNQNLVPFLVVSTPNRYVLYPGFHYAPGEEAPELGAVVKSARLALDKFQGLDARSIANGDIWLKWGDRIDLDSRVDWKLLDELEKLGHHLRHEYHLSGHQAHALIGKYVFLRYLHDRGILSTDRLAEWGIVSTSVFGREATLQGFVTVNQKLDAWLNGLVFPVDTSPNGVAEAAIRQTAAVFAGDQIDGQLSLFEAYDFAFIPIETLSVIYQQFLHAEERGRDKGAYYTPVNLVDLMLDEVENRRPLSGNATVFDPACGSGAFLVQAYRRLIERELRTRQTLRPSELRTLLTRHVYGIDQDEDACRVAALSLVLTLLDYVDPPDLLRYPEFKLPTLYGNNIVQGDFFDVEFPWGDKHFDWIVGNPPWLEVKPAKEDPAHTAALAWMRVQRKERPIGGWQLAEAFAWKAGEHLAPEGAVALLMPAMSLFKVQSKSFRAAFFSGFQVWCVANFANLAYVLFGKRAESPAVALFYSHVIEEDARQENILTFTPFLANQPAMRRGKGRCFKESWALTVNGGELRHVATSEAMKGDGLTWKLAMWGSHRDRRLLAHMANRLPTFRDFRVPHGLLAHQGVALRAEDADESVEYVQELVGKLKVDPKKLGKRGTLYAFPKESLEIVPASLAYVRKRSGVAIPLSICRPPHILVGRSREWAIFSNEFIVIPQPQVGIAGKSDKENLLKALALYLISDFARYHQLFHSAEMGVQGTVADIGDIEALPIPLDRLSDGELKEWANLYDALASCCQQRQTALLEEHNTKLRALEQQASDLIYRALCFSETERWLVEDLVNCRLQLIKGKTGEDASAPPTLGSLAAYGEALRYSLDGFLGEQDTQHHYIDVYHCDGSGIVVISLEDGDLKRSAVQTHAGDASLSAEMEAIRFRLMREHTHWLYFERGLTLFDGKRAYLIKPLQKLHWLRSQALLDADNLISDMLGGSATAQ